MTEQLKQAASESFPGLRMELSLDERNIVTVRGECETWQQLVDVGHFLAKQEGVRNVVNEMTVKDLVIPKKDYSQAKAAGEARGIVKETDVVIVGAGVCGCGIARELAKYDMDITVVEMSDDVCTGASKANNGNIHPGMSVKPGTLKAKLNIEGNRMYDKWAEELNFKLDWCGCIAVVTDERLMKAAEMVYQVAVMNGVHKPEIIDEARAYEIEPALKARNLNIVGGAWFPSFGQVDSYEVVVALAENAADNGVDFLLNTTVADVLYEDGQVTGVVTDKGIIRAKYVINCAGVYSDEISAMAGDKSYTIHPRKGTLAILDKHCKPEFDSVVMVVDGKQVQNKKNEESKGGAMCITLEGQMLLGPSATEVPDKEDNTTTAEDLWYAMATNTNPNAGYKDIIKTFCGVRPADYSEDFIIEMSPVTHGFINVGAIQSPGFASAPAIAKMVEEIWLEDAKAAEGGAPALRVDYNPHRAAKVEFRHMSREEQDQLIAKDPRYGRVICRCETVTEGEILDAIHSPVVPTSVDAIKRRTRAGMGRCQGGFCQPKVLEILAREIGKDWTEIHLKDAGSRILFAESRASAMGEGSEAAQQTGNTDAGGEAAQKGGR